MLMNLCAISQIGHWNLRWEVLSQPHGSGLQVQASLDHREKIWLNWTVEDQCLRTTAGYKSSKSRTLLLYVTKQSIVVVMRTCDCFLCRSRPQRGFHSIHVCGNQTQFDHKRQERS